VLEGDRRVWLVAEPGDEVDESRHHPGAAVVVGPATATRAQVDRARRDARRLVALGGPVVAAAGIRIRTFRTARLEGGAESRRDAVLAAVEVLGGKGLHRIGEPASVLVALFSERATKRVGAAALTALADGHLSPVRLAVAASDLLGPEQLETVLALRSPPGAEPVPRGDVVLLGRQLAAVLGPYTARRRLDLLRTLWDDVVDWQVSALARGRARRRRVSEAAYERWCRTLRRLDGAWWQAQAARQLGPEPDTLALATWVPGPDVWQAALVRAFHECTAATTLLRTALAAEDQPVQAAVLAHLDALEHLARVGDEGGPAVQRAAMLAATVALASEPNPGGGDRLSGRDVGALVATQLRGAYELAQATLAGVAGLAMAIHQLPPDGNAAPGASPVVGDWRRVAGFSPARHPATWPFRFLGPAGVPPLAMRLATSESADPADVELLDDGLWIADLADALAAWNGHPQAEVSGVHGISVDPAGPGDDDEAGVPLLESVPLAAAGAAQLLAIGAQPPARPKAWAALVTALVAAAENLGLDEPFPLAGEVAAADRALLPGTDLRIEVARTPRQLAEWGNYMGNCIAGYAEDATRRYALVALRDPTGTLVANVAIYRAGRHWAVSEAFARFNEDLAADLRALLDAWVKQIPVATPARGVRAGAPPRRTSPGGGRRPPVRDRLLRAGGRLAGDLGDLGATDDVARTALALAPVARELGWAGESGDAEWEAVFVAVARPRRPGPLAAAVGRTLGRGCPLAELWEATSCRPLAAAIERVGDLEVDLRRLTDPTVPAALRLGLHEPGVRAARAVDLAGRRVRVALAELLAVGDAALDRAVVARPHTGFVTAAVLTLTARAGQVVQPVDWVPVAGDGSLPGRPHSSLADEGGPWTTARAAATEMGVTAERLDEILADAPRRHLVVPAAWTAPGGWAGLWAKAHRVTRSLRRD